MLDRNKTIFIGFLLFSFYHSGLPGVFLYLTISGMLSLMSGEYPINVGRFNNQPNRPLSRRPFGSNIRTISDIPKPKKS